MSNNSKTVLVVDDSSTFRTMVTFALKKMASLDNHIQAADGLEALDALAKNEIDLIICDINMPNMDGLEFLKTIKGDEKFRNIPVIMITTDAMEEDRNLAKSLGANAYLQKPFKPSELFAELKNIPNFL
ncbi:MAG: response regulator [Nitrospinota bacterium]|nr:response regulator [Nitrospinota bacterium]